MYSRACFYGNKNLKGEAQIQTSIPCDENLVTGYARRLDAYADFFLVVIRPV